MKTEADAVAAGALYACGKGPILDDLNSPLAEPFFRGWSSVTALRAVAVQPVTQPKVLRASAAVPLESTKCDHCQTRFSIAARQFIKAMAGQAVKAVCPECECLLQLIEVDGRIASFEG